MAKLDLHKNTISEFQDDLMLYYDLCKKEQAKHVGPWITSLHQITIPEFDIKEEIIQDRTILRDNYGPTTRTKLHDYLRSCGFNKENTKMRMVRHDNLPEPLMQTLLQHIPMKHPVFTLNIQPPGGMDPIHEDTWSGWYRMYPDLAKKYTFEDTARFVVFVTPQYKGQFFSVDNSSISWVKGNAYGMPYYCNHGSANAGFHSKLLVQCLGIKK